MADVAARTQADPNWQGRFNAVVRDEQALRDCDGEPVVTFPDGNDAGDRVRVTWTCQYSPRITSNMWSGTSATFTGESVIPPTDAP